MARSGAVLLWGAKSQARIIEALLRREGVRDIVLFEGGGVALQCSQGGWQT